MAKVSSQFRILIPRDLTKLIDLEPGEVGVFFDRNEKAIFLSKTQNADKDYCIGTRRLDEKNRIAINKKILKLIGASKSSELVIAVRNKRIYIFLCPERG